MLRNLPREKKLIGNNALRIKNRYIQRKANDLRNVELKLLNNPEDNTQLRKLAEVLYNTKKELKEKDRLDAAKKREEEMFKLVKDRELMWEAQHNQKEIENQQREAQREQEMVRLQNKHNIPIDFPEFDPLIYGPGGRPFIEPIDETKLQNLKTVVKGLYKPQPSIDDLINEQLKTKVTRSLGKRNQIQQELQQRLNTDNFGLKHNWSTIDKITNKLNTTNGTQYSPIEVANVMTSMTTMTPMTPMTPKQGNLTPKTSSFMNQSVNTSPTLNTKSRLDLNTKSRLDLNTKSRLDLTHNTNSFTDENDVKNVRLSPTSTETTVMSENDRPSVYDLKLPALINGLRKAKYSMEDFNRKPKAQEVYKKQIVLIENGEKENIAWVPILAEMSPKQDNIKIKTSRTSRTPVGTGMKAKGLSTKQRKSNVIKASKKAGANYIKF
jgi:hypothetical protein